MSLLMPRNSQLGKLATPSGHPQRWAPGKSPSSIPLRLLASGEASGYLACNQPSLMPLYAMSWWSPLTAPVTRQCYAHAKRTPASCVSKRLPVSAMPRPSTELRRCTPDLLPRILAGSRQPFLQLVMLPYRLLALPSCSAHPTSLFLGSKHGFSSWPAFFSTTAAFWQSMISTRLRPE